MCCCPSLFFDMIRLTANSAAAQTFYVTPFNNRKDLDVSITHYLMEFKGAKDALADSPSRYFILNAVVDNERYTEVRMYTNADAAVSGNLKIEATGLYEYTIYGQDSSTNLDPTDAAVKGVLETGSVQVVSSDSVATQATFSVPGYIYYRE